MSDADSQATTVLLPGSSVTVFSQDKETLQAVAELLKDWRFARVKIDAQAGDVGTAIETYKSYASPDLVIVQTEVIDDSFTGRLEELAVNCGEKTTAIVIGPVNDVYLYRRLIEMGVSDYLVKPIKKPVLADVIAKTLIKQVGTTGARLIAFIGAKGGVGTSAMAQAYAWGISKTLGEKTILIDASGGWSVLGVGMGFEPSTTLAEAARAAANKDEDSLNRMLFKASDKLNVLASGGDTLLDPAANVEQLEEILSMVMVKYPVVLADLSGAAADLQSAVISRANQVVVVSTPALPALRQARSLIQEIKEIRGGSDKEISMILNMHGMSPANEVSKGDIEKALEFKPSAIVPFNAKVFAAAESEGRKVIDDKEGAVIVHNILLPVLAGVISGDYEGAKVSEDTGKEGLLGGLMSKLKVKA
jgi:pilus assembly protein CpaE